MRRIWLYSLALVALGCGIENEGSLDSFPTAGKGGSSLAGQGGGGASAGSSQAGFPSMAGQSGAGTGQGGAGMGGAGKGGKGGMGGAGQGGAGMGGAGMGGKGGEAGAGMGGEGGAGTGQGGAGAGQGGAGMNQGGAGTNQGGAGAGMGGAGEAGAGMGGAGMSGAGMGGAGMSGAGMGGAGMSGAGMGGAGEGGAGMGGAGMGGAGMGGAGMGGAGTGGSPLEDAVLWLDARYNVMENGKRVTSWMSKSKGSSLAVVPPTPAEGPEYITDEGTARLRFSNAESLGMQDTPALQVIDSTLIVRVKVTLATNQPLVTKSVGNELWGLNLAPSDVYYTVNGPPNQLATSFVTQTWTTFVAITDTQNGMLSIKSSKDLNSDKIKQAVAPAMGPLGIGIQYAGNTEKLTGDLGVVALFDKVLDEKTIATIDQELQTAWP